MEGNHSSVDDNDTDWNTDDEIDNFTLSPSSAVLSWEVSSSCPSSSNCKVLDQFIGMGFSMKMVEKAIEEHGEENTEAVLETLLTYSALESSPHEQQQMDSDLFSSDDESFFDDFSDEDITSPASEEENLLMSLITMGYKKEEATTAIERCGIIYVLSSVHIADLDCNEMQSRMSWKFTSHSGHSASNFAGPSSSLVELTDFLSAAQLVKEEDLDALFSHEEMPRLEHVHTHDPKKKQKVTVSDISKRKRQMGLICTDDETLRLPNPMIGFGIPTGACQSRRILPNAAIGPPYFYYENVALAPKGVWETISTSLYDVPPEFVDSKHFCCAARKRGYVHNLPIANRFPLTPLPPQTIHEAFPLT
ncbi:hypothetical protein ACLB2K_066597 [Fragaria x ananassa]